ncbi:Abi-alpha family protein [Solimonas sp. SE-A11]|uniref:Abi-alpha family protein n=1 Tax=Solimonas sp. SE-A11 TaxID=3054954 RepID=UPI00259CE94B|nr:Abi-alpha family protein [Solimonas sp. SE-A11]MDM4770182.1 Abi-alpha family protein [Solimonas sp. SE-A11]
MKALGDSGAGRRVAKLLRRLPGADRASERLQAVERGLLQQLKRRMDRLEPPSSVSVLAVAMRSVADRSLGGASLQDLLQRSSEQGRDEVQAEYFGWVTSQLVPVQARLLSALSDGSTYPVIHVLAGSRIGFTAEPVVEWISNIGRNAGVQWNDTTPVYIGRLRALGLVDTGPEDPARRVQYEMLETEQPVRDSIARLHKGGLKGHIVRRVLMLSALGRAFWEDGRITEDLDGSLAASVG